MYGTLGIFLLAANAAVVLSSNETEINRDICRNASVDASTRTKDGTTYLFIGNYYWRHINGATDIPRLISRDWKGVTGPIDAAFTWNDGSTFIFKGEDYWRFTNKDALPGYPRKIEDGFKGIPSNIDAALVWENDGYTYFFKGNKYWRYVPKAINPIHGDYPQPLKNWHGIPDYITAALRFEEGLTYFFKGEIYYKYDNEKSRVASGYPMLAATEWFSCDKMTANQTTDWENYEREMPKDSENGKNEILKSMENLQATMRILESEQRIMQSNIRRIPQNTFELLRNNTEESQAGNEKEVLVE